MRMDICANWGNSRLAIGNFDLDGVAGDGVSFVSPPVSTAVGTACDGCGTAAD
eukprot:CAMPEP_0194351690 /NCGR_PEP_ID=MMETSP0174-20130528/69_1 /TAXON_ID=216777 /ORGANISM="Proboscia alata, Strain PI-D3" /LENGTH=52 /DNA_ID=CAMNT_0039119343 /DNA_START=79 /DNA_END=237 /DNA_ORIENTATION=-